MSTVGSLESRKRPRSPLPRLRMLAGASRLLGAPDNVSGLLKTVGGIGDKFISRYLTGQWHKEQGLCGDHKCHAELKPGDLVEFARSVYGVPAYEHWGMWIGNTYLGETVEGGWVIHRGTDGVHVSKFFDAVTRHGPISGHLWRVNNDPPEGASVSITGAPAGDSGTDVQRRRRVITSDKPSITHTASPPARSTTTATRPR